MSLKALRRAQGLTQAHIASRTGISAQLVHKYETGARALPAHLLSTWAAAYGVEPGDIAWGLPGDGADDDEDVDVRTAVPA